MNNILNVRIQKLIRENLWEYARYILGILGLSILIPLLLHLLFGTQLVVITIGGSLTTIDNIGDINLESIFNFLSVGFFIFFMFIAGITTGYELPQHVRRGIARKEYFVSTVLSTVIVSLLIAPLLLTLNMIFNLFATSGSRFYNAFYIGGGEISTLIVHFLAYIALFLLGCLIAIVWQVVGWKIAVGLIIIALMISAILGWNLAIVGDLVTFTTADHWFEIEWAFSNGILGGITLAMIAILGSATYALTKNVSVDVT